MRDFRLQKIRTVCDMIDVGHIRSDDSVIISGHDNEYSDDKVVIERENICTHCSYEEITEL